MNLEPFKIKYRNQKKLIDQKSAGLTTQVTEFTELFENRIFRIHNFEI